MSSPAVSFPKLPASFIFTDFLRLFSLQEREFKNYFKKRFSYIFRNKNEHFRIAALFWEKLKQTGKLPVAIFFEKEL